MEIGGSVDVEVAAHRARVSGPFRDAFRRALLDVDRPRALRVMMEARDALFRPESGEAPTAIELLDTVLTPVLAEMGAAWERGQLALTQIYMAGRISEEVTERFLPEDGGERRVHPRMAVVVLEDHHMLGKRMVVSTLRAGGFAPLDYGSADVATSIARAQRDGLEVLLVSTLMLAAALRVRALVDGLRAAGVGARVIVGGAPFRLDPSLFRTVGADAMGATAADAVHLVLALADGGRRS